VRRALHHDAMLAMLASIPCRATAHGCSSDNLVGVLLIVLLIGAAVMGALALVWFHWERGPFWRVMRLLSWTPRGRTPRR
jgi:hypothetical protein